LRKTIAQILTVENEAKLNLRAPAPVKEEKKAAKKPKVTTSEEKTA